MHSTRGNQRSNYPHYEDAFRKTLLVIKSSDGKALDHAHSHANYQITLKNEVICKSNQIITGYIHQANIPTTTYNINRFSQKFYLHLPDFSSRSNVTNGVVEMTLPKKNYTRATLKTELQRQFDVELKAKDVAGGLLRVEHQPMLPPNFGLYSDESFAQEVIKDYVTIASNATLNFNDATFLTNLKNKSGLDLAPIISTLKADLGQQKLIFQRAVPGNAVSTTYTTPAVGTQPAKTGRVSIGLQFAQAGDSTTISHIYIQSLPLFHVDDCDDGQRFQISRIDLLGCLPNLTSLDNRFNLASSRSNSSQLGLFKPVYGNSKFAVPTSNDMTANIYNTSEVDDDTKNFGSIMRATYTNKEFKKGGTAFVAKTAGVVATDETFQRVYFPNFPFLNVQSSYLIKSNALRGNAIATHTDHSSASASNVIAQIPVNVNQDQMINYEPKNPIRFNLGNAKSLKQIDIRIEDDQGQLMDFNGCPHTLTILLEVFEVVSIPLHREDSQTYSNGMNRQQVEQFPRRRESDVHRRWNDPRPIAQPILTNNAFRNAPQQRSSNSANNAPLTTM